MVVKSHNPGENTTMSWQYEFGKELTEKFGEKVDISGPVRDSTPNRERIREIVEKELEAMPENERLDHIQVLFREWDTPMVRVWCKSSNFDYQNSKVEEKSVFHRGKRREYQVDTRPF